ncbi:hypothetical protein M422DRAFT_268702 [Sphaerobolus stellatus SS14]|uniref:Unplaced genomic scaffold SPHSTscaffold_199, whole genome shotgun sequence n=1 Tax=Sphaerobolus stellatus (strain SS14) TaxID=990650 RepID=A0A0C9UWY9_SPHS4|nr:hypothetical protein M422DRAFT_268702 [Sphaerobolus stellatus SS14]
MASEEKITPFKVSKHLRDFRPTASEREAMTRQFNEQKLTVDALTTQIDSMSRVIRELKQRRDELQTLLVHGADLLSPIRKLLVEFLKRIFIFCIPRINDKIFHEEGHTNPLEEGEPHPESVRDTLYQVSDYWCDTLQATPEAWSTVVVEMLTKERIMEFWYCTQRSKAALLDLYIRSRYLAATNRVLLLDPYRNVPIVSKDYLSTLRIPFMFAVSSKS